MSVLMGIGQQFLMQEENRVFGLNEISIHKFKNGFSFNDNLRSIYFQTSSFVTKEIDELLKSLDFFKNKEKGEISFVSFNPQSILIPFQLYNENFKDLYFNNSLSDKNLYKANFDILNSNEIVNLYQSEDEIFKNSLLIKNLSHITHYKTLILNSLFEIDKKDLEEKVVYIHLQKSSFDIFYFIENKFHLNNSFIINNSDEFLYYFFYFSEQFNLKPENFSIVFLGKYDFFKDYYNGIRDFHIKLSFLTNPTNNQDYLNSHPAPFLANVFY